MHAIICNEQCYFIVVKLGSIILKDGYSMPSMFEFIFLQLHMFTVKDIHHSAITSIVWSQNAMKLFSGDEDGVVVCTEINYHEV